MRASHLFNTLEARGAISVTERAHYIGRIRNLARKVMELISRRTRPRWRPYKMDKKLNSVDFLLDIHTEPLPARFVAPALDQLKLNAAKWLEGKIDHGEIAVAGTLRHLILTVKGVAAKGNDKTEKFKGPKEQAWRTSDGMFTPPRRASRANTASSPAASSRSRERSTPRSIQRASPAAFLFQAMIPELMKSLQFPKFMTWEETGFKFWLSAACADRAARRQGRRRLACRREVRTLGVRPPRAGEAPAALRIPSKHSALAASAARHRRSR